MSACPRVRDGFGQPLRAAAAVVRTLPSALLLSAPATFDSQQYLSAHPVSSSSTTAASPLSSSASSAALSSPVGGVDVVAFVRGRPRLGEWIPDASPWRRTHAATLDTRQGAIQFLPRTKCRMNDVCFECA